MTIYKLVLKCAEPRLPVPRQLKSVGDHVLAERLRRGLLQKDVAAALGVTECTVWNWENGRSSPPVHRCAQLIRFLGCDPFPEPKSFAGRLIAFRRAGGLRTKEAAAMAGVDSSSWSAWETSEASISAASREKVERLLFPERPTAET